MLTSTVFLTLLISAASASALQQTSFKLHHSRHTWTPSASGPNTRDKFKHPLFADHQSLKGTRGTVPMNGGTLGLGAFYCNMTIGSDNQVFSTLVDTGSSNIWITGFNTKTSTSYAPLSCSAPQCKKCTVHVTEANLLGDDPAKCLFGPPMCEQSTDTCWWGITYGGGGTMCTGTLATDKICFEGTDLCTTSAPFGMVEVNVPVQGALPAIIGLAFPTNACNPSCVQTLLDGIVVENPGLQKKFSMCLTPNNGGVLDFGFVNQSRLAGPVTQLKVTHEHWYNLAIVDLVVGGRGQGLPHIAYSVTNDVIGSFVDSGTTVLGLGPLPFSTLQDTFTKYHGDLPGVADLFNGQCVPTSQIDPVIGKFPSIDVVIDASGSYVTPDHKTFSIPATSYLLQAGNTYCLGIAQISGIGVILGDVFLENYVTVYDPTPGAATVGLAPLKAGTCQ